MTTKSFTGVAEIEVSLDEWETEELISEIELRGLKVEFKAEAEDLDQWAQEAFNSLSKGDKEGAIEALRTYLCDITGRILP